MNRSVKSFLLNYKFFHIYTYITFVFAALLVNQYYIYRFNQVFQIPLTNLINEPSLYPNDPFAATLPYYSSVLWRLVAFGIRYIPLEPLLLALFLLEKILVIYAVRQLARVLAPNSQLAAVGAMMLFALGIKPILGGGTIVADYLEQTALSIAFFLLAIASLYQFRSISCAMWLAIGFNLNSMYGTYAISYLVAVCLIEPRYRKEWRKWIGGFGLFLLLASPAIIMTFSTLSRKSTDNSLWITACKIFYPEHFYPHVWQKQDIAKFIMVIVLVVSVLYQNRHKLEKLFKYVTTWAFVSILWLIYAFVAAYVTSSPAMLVMHPARGTDIWYCIAAITLVSVCAIKIEESRNNQKRVLYLIAFIGSILIWSPMVLEPYMLGVLLILLLWQPFSSYLFGKDSIKHLSLLLIFLVIFIGIKNFNTRLAKTGSIDKALIGRPSYTVEQIANWAKLNTSKNALFLTQPDGIKDWSYFRLLAQRSVFTSWSDGAAMLWDRTFANTWVDRLNALGLDITKNELDHNKARAELRTLYEKLQDEDVKRLQLRFAIDYWITPVKHLSKFPVFFQNESDKVLKINSLN